MTYRVVKTPIGPLLIAGDGIIVSEIHFAPFKEVESDEQAYAGVAGQLAEYFAGERRTFEIPIALSGTPFQLSVWSALQRIPYGEVRSYSDIARQIGKPESVRAVGAANGANPIPIIVPCHRVIGANGSLTGFGGGIAVKRRLLDLESGQRSATIPL
jgi:methylated-DNA-[protein]-cysteine S-methyltransferase